MRIKTNFARRNKRRAERAVAAPGEKGLIELIGLRGYYCLVSMTLNTFDFGLREGEKPEPT